MTPAPASLAALATLRWVAVACQIATMLVATGPLALAVPRGPLWSAIGLLAVFNLWVHWRLRRGAPASHATVFSHLALDIAVLAWLIAWSGGIANPFTSLFLLPIAFAAIALPPRWTYATAAVAGLGYAASTLFGRPLPHVHGQAVDGFDLHLWGMAVNFLVSAAVVLYCFSRLAAAQRQREHELAGLRERFARNEGIVALATHAASVAHELNTPLATLTLALDDLAEQQTDAAQREDLHTLRALVDVCRDRVRELAAPADDGTRQAGVDLERVIDRWILVRPTIALVRSGHVDASVRVDPAIGHLLQALLNNAADAGEAAGAPRVELHLDADATGVRGEIRDHGAGFGDARLVLPGTLHASSKPDGFGIGLALGHATVERLGGALSMRANGASGVCIAFDLPAQGTA